MVTLMRNKKKICKKRNKNCKQKHKKKKRKITFNYQLIKITQINLACQTTINLGAMKIFL